MSDDEVVERYALVRVIVGASCDVWGPEHPPVEWAMSDDEVTK